MKTDGHIKTPQCGFNRQASHSAGRYVCTCGYEQNNARARGSDTERVGNVQQSHAAPAPAGEPINAVQVQASISYVQSEKDTYDMDDRDTKQKLLKKTELEQLLYYVNNSHIDGCYYGNRAHFEARHARIIQWLDEQIAGAK